MEERNINLKRVIGFFFTLVMTASGCAANGPRVEEVLERPVEIAAFADSHKSQSVSGESTIGDAFALASMGDRAYEIEEWVVAEKFYRRLVAKVPGDAYGYFRLGNVLMQRSEVEGAINAYNKSIERDPTNVRALKNRSLAFLLSAELHLENTVRILDSLDDEAAGNYRRALSSLQRLNDIPLNETVSPIEGLHSEL